MIPQHLKPYISEAIKTGLRDPQAILEYAIDRNNALLRGMYVGQSRRAQVVRESLALDVWAAVK